MFYKIQGKVVDGEVQTTGVDWGRPLKVMYTAGDFYVVSRAAYSAWNGRGQPRKSVPRAFLLFHVSKGQALCLCERDAGRYADAVFLHLSSLARKWNENMARSGQERTLRYSKRSVSLDGQSVEIYGPLGLLRPSVLANFFVEQAVTPNDVIVITGRISRPVREMVVDAQQLLSLIHI